MKTLTTKTPAKDEVEKREDNLYRNLSKMYDEEIQGTNESEQSVYEKFMEFLKIRQFIDKLWDILDDMEDDDLPTNKTDE